MKAKNRDKLLALVMQRMTYCNIDAGRRKLEMIGGALLSAHKSMDRKATMDEINAIPVERYVPDPPVTRPNANDTDFKDK